MNKNFSVFEVILLVGIAQGFVMSALLFLKKPAHVSRSLLACILLIFNVLCVKILLHTTHLWDNPSIRYLPISLELLIQPFIYFYALSLTNPSFRFEKNHLWHFLPYLIFALFSIVIYLKVLPIESINEKDTLANTLFFNQIKGFEDILSVISSVIYWVLSYQVIVKYYRITYLQTANSDAPTLLWLRNILILSAILVSLLGLSIWQNQFGLWQFFHIFLAILIYYMGLRGYNVNPLLTIPTNTHETFSKSQKNTTETSNSERLAIKEAITNALQQEKIYQDVDLTIDSLANYLKLPPNLVSSVINNELATNFRTIINQYRIDEVKQRLLKHDFAKLSIAGLAYECGFNSEASFYRVFKSSVGISPKEFIQSQK
jgi:AraC-like DNA-binding protein